MPVTTVTPQVLVQINTLPQRIVQIIKLYSADHQIRDLLDKAEKITKSRGDDFDIDMLDRVITWTDLQYFFGDVSEVVETLESFNKSFVTQNPPFSGPEVTKMQREARIESRSREVQQKIDDALKYQPEADDDKEPIRISIQRRMELDRIEKNRTEAQSQYAGNRELLEAEMERLDILERQVRQGIKEDREKEQEVFDTLADHEKKVERLQQIEDYKQKRRRERAPELAELHQTIANTREEIVERIEKQEDRPDTELTVTRVKDLGGSTVDTVAAKSRLATQRYPAFELNPELIDEDTGLLRVDKINIGLGRASGKGMTEEEIRHLRGVVEGTKLAIIEEQKRDHIAQILATQIENSVRNLSGAGNEAAEIAEDIGQSLSRDLQRVHDNALKADEGHRGADSAVRDYMSTPAFESETLKATTKALHRQDPGISEIDARTEAMELLPRMQPGLETTPSFPVYEIEDLKTTPTHIEPKFRIGVLDKSGKVERHYTTVAIGNSPVQLAKGIRRALGREGKLQEVTETMDRFFAESRLPPELQRERVPVGPYRQAKNVAFMQSTLDIEQNFRRNPLQYIHPVLLGPRIAYHTLTPNAVKDRITLWGEKVRGEEFQKKYAPALHPFEWANMWTLGQAKYAASLLSPALYYDNKGRVGLGPFAWLNSGWNAGLDSLGRKGTLWHKRTVETIGLPNAEKSLRLNFLKHVSGRLTDRRKNRNPISIILGTTLWAGGAALVDTIIARMEGIPAIRPFFQNIRGLRKSWQYGSGWADPEYIADWKNQAKQPMPDIAYDIAHRTGKLAAAGSDVWNVAKIAGKSLFKGYAAGFITSLITGNPTMGLVWGIGVGGTSAVRGFLSNPRFGGIWELTPDARAYTPGGLALKHSPWYSRTGGRFAKFAEAWNAPLDELRAMEGISQRVKNVVYVTRNLPLDGLFLSATLAQLGLPLPLVLAPTAFELTLRGLRGLGRLAKVQNVLRYWGAITGVTQSIGGLLISSWELSKVGGIFGLMSSVYKQGFTLPNITKLIGVPLTYVSIRGLALLLGATNPLVSLAVTGVYYLTDQILRIVTGGKGLWELALHKVVDPLKGLFGTIAEKGTQLVMGVASGFLGILGLIQAIATGDPQQLIFTMIMGATSVATLVPIFSTWIFPMSAYTPKIPPPVSNNVFISRSSKTAQGNYNNDPSKVLYEYSYYVPNTGIAKKLTVKEEDYFGSINNSASLFKNVKVNLIESQPDKVKFDLVKRYGLLKLQFNNTITPEGPGNFYKRRFVLDLGKPLKNFTVNGKFCNTLLLNIDEKDIVLKRENYEPQYEQVKLKPTCLDKSGNPLERRTSSVSANNLTSLPINSASGRITSCFDYRNGVFHSAIDIGAQAGTPVHAAADGEMHTLNDTYISLGNWLWVEHDKNVYTWYGHLSSVSTNPETGNPYAPGDKVKSGDVIGYVGSSGNSTGNHLHFVVGDDISPYNPCLELDICDGKTYPFSQTVFNAHGYSECTVTYDRTPIE